MTDDIVVLKLSESKYESINEDFNVPADSTEMILEFVEDLTPLNYDGDVLFMFQVIFAKLIYSTGAYSHR